eukprot:gene3353-3580_t
MEFYRSTTVGTALIKTLNELLASEEITNEQALEVLKTFDEQFSETLRNHVILDRFATKHEARGKLVNYNNFEDLWKIEIEDVSMSFGDRESRHLDRLRLLFSTKGRSSESSAEKSTTTNDSQNK